MDGIKGLSNKLLASVREVLKTNQHLPRNEDLLKIASIEEMNKHQIEEKLVGNQHRIDANKNGKIDRRDFKLLLGGRGKKKLPTKEPSMVDEAGQPLQYSGSVGPSADTDTHKDYTITIPGHRELGDYHDEDLHRKIRKENPHLEHHEVSAIVNSAGDEESKQTVEHKGKTYTHHVVNHQEPVRLYDEVNAVREEQIDEALSLGVLAAKHFDHHLNATQGGNFDLSDSQMASHAKKADAVRAKIEHHFGSKVAHDVAAHSETAADYEEGTIGGGNSHPVFAKKYLGGVEHKKYNDQIDKQDLKMHGDTGVTTHHLP